jgi:hypothetical protein
MHGVQVEGSDIAALVESYHQRGPDPQYRIPGEAAGSGQSRSLRKYALLYFRRRNITVLPLLTLMCGTVVDAMRS